MAVAPGSPIRRTWRLREPSKLETGATGNGRCRWLLLPQSRKLLLRDLPRAGRGARPQCGHSLRDVVLNHNPPNERRRVTVSGWWRCSGTRHFGQLDVAAEAGTWLPHLQQTLRRRGADPNAHCIRTGPAQHQGVALADQRIGAKSSGIGELRAGTRTRVEADEGVAGTTGVGIGGIRGESGIDAQGRIVGAGIVGPEGLEAGDRVPRSITSHAAIAEERLKATGRVVVPGGEGVECARTKRSVVGARGVASQRCVSEGRILTRRAVVLEGVQPHCRVVVPARVVEEGAIALSRVAGAGGVGR